jgi:hypothetical protein
VLRADRVVVDYIVCSSRLTLNNSKSALISLLAGCDDEFVAIDDIDGSSSSSSTSSTLQMSSSLVGFEVFLLVVGGSTGKKGKTMNINNDRQTAQN